MIAIFFPKHAAAASARQNLKDGLAEHRPEGSKHHHQCTTTISSHSVRGDPHQMMIKMPNRELEHYKPTSANYRVDLEISSRCCCRFSQRGSFSQALGLGVGHRELRPSSHDFFCNLSKNIVDVQCSASQPLQ